MTPSDPQQAIKMADYMSKSGLVPKDFAGQPHKILVAAAMGQKLGLDPFSAMAGIAVINGRPSLWGDVLRSLVLAHPKLENLKEYYEGEGDSMVAVCEITRKGMDVHTEKFGVKDAKAAGLWGKNVWKSFSKDMLLNRAFGRAARRRFSDALCGLSVADEMQDAEVIKKVSVVDERPELTLDTKAENIMDMEPQDLPTQEPIQEAEQLSEEMLDAMGDGAGDYE